jgi:hypothetical protein
MVDIAVYYDFTKQLLAKITDIYRCYYGHIDVLIEGVHSILIRSLRGKSYLEQKNVLRDLLQEFPEYIDTQKLFWADGLTRTLIRCIVELADESAHSSPWTKQYEYSFLHPCPMYHLMKSYKYEYQDNDYNREYQTGEPEYCYYKERVIALARIKDPLVRIEKLTKADQSRVESEIKDLASQDLQGKHSDPIDLIPVYHDMSKQILHLVIEAFEEIEYTDHLQTYISEIVLNLLEDKSSDQREVLIVESEKYIVKEITRTDSGTVQELYDE